jgi:hypothetical protein
MPSTAPKDIQFTLKAGTEAFKTVEALQKEFGVEKTRAGKTTVTKLQGRILLSAFLETLVNKASEETLVKLAEEASSTSDESGASKASEYLRAIYVARQATNPAPKKAAEDMSVEELRKLLAQKESAQKAGAQTKNVAKV